MKYTHIRKLVARQSHGLRHKATIAIGLTGIEMLSDVLAVGGDKFFAGVAVGMHRDPHDLREAVLSMDEFERRLAQGGKLDLSALRRILGDLQKISVQQTQGEN